MKNKLLVLSTILLAALWLTRVSAQDDVQTNSKVETQYAAKTTDWHVHPQGRTLARAAELSRERGVRFGILEHPGPSGGRYPIQTDSDLQNYIHQLNNFPFYKGLQPVYPGWYKAFSPSVLNQLDYILMDAMTMPQEDGSFKRIWRRNTTIEDPEEFIKEYIAFSVKVINEQRIDIFGWPTYLPVCIADQYDKLWTNERMQIVIDAAVKKKVALEINEVARVPSARFIKLAKQAGAKFTFGTDSRNQRCGIFEYGERMAKECDLTEKDMWSLPDQKRQ